ncbi:Inositol polyphosphate kinase [Gracilaria domingensis]|nr:Inositol polyphosphate kinase [Gracilaria domingensis]
MKLRRARGALAHTHRRDRDAAGHKTPPSPNSAKHFLKSSRKISDRLRRAGNSSHSSDMQTLVTLNRPRAAPRDGDDSVTMSNAGQLVLPTIFSATPVPEDSHQENPSFSQAAGHDGSFLNDGHALVKRAPDREAVFYEMAQSGLWPARLLPDYYGRVEPSSIKIENLVFGYKRPCVIDIKMGIHTVEEQETNLFKKLKMNALDLVTGSRSEGCRLEGLSMYRAMAHVTGNKAQSHSVSMSTGVTLGDVLTFFLTDESGVRTDVAQRFQQMVQDILKQFEQNTSYKFIGSSLLLIYDNDNRAPYRLWSRALRNLHVINPNVRLSEDHIVGLTRRTRCDVRMIDFAHWNPSTDGTRDEGYITGLHTILDALRSIRFYRAKPIFSLLNAVEDVLDHEAKTGSSSTDRGIKFEPTEGHAFTFDTLWNEMPSASLGASDDTDSSAQSYENIQVLPSEAL